MLSDKLNYKNLKITVVSDCCANDLNMNASSAFCYVFNDFISLGSS